ncbi:MAG: hypothetical protein ACJAZB_000939 [Psychrosphaera sp.]|jgi:hypothetical protein
MEFIKFMFNYNLQIVMALIVTFVLAACTSKELYSEVQNNRKAHCRTLPPQDIEDCLNNLNDKTYDEYEKLRQELIKNRK